MLGFKSQFNVNIFFFKFQVKETYYCNGEISIPAGKIEFKNNYYSPHYFLQKNRLKISTPFPNYKEIVSNIQMKLELMVLYNVGFEVSILNETEWQNYGFKVNYANSTDVLGFALHNVSTVLILPLRNSNIFINSVVKLNDASSYRANFTIDGLETKLQLFGFFDNQLTVFDSSFGLSLASPMLPHYLFNVFLKREISEINNMLDFGIDVDDNHVKNNVSLSGIFL